MNKKNNIEKMIIKTLQSTMSEFDSSTTLQKPNKFYKYRTCSRNNINNLQEGKAWFSSPTSWNDKIDCTILLDLEEFCRNYETNPQLIMLQSIKGIVRIIEKKLGIRIKNGDEDFINAITLFNDNGTLNNEGKEYLKSNCNEFELQQYNVYQNQINELFKSIPFENAIKQILYFNDNIKNSINAYCLSMSGDNNTQWSRYADEEKGFCIEYTLPQNIDNPFVANLYPIIYEEKEEVDFIELFMELLNIGVNHENLFESEVLRKAILSLLTKEPKWASEEEWRIILSKKEYPNNLIDFNFATAIILGKDINLYNKRRLINIAKEQNLKVYQRKMNATNSDFIIEEVNI